MRRTVVITQVTPTDVRYARVVHACLDRDYTGATPPMRVKISKAEALRLLSAAERDCVGRWDDGDDLTILPGEVYGEPAQT